MRAELARFLDLPSSLRARRRRKPESATPSAANAQYPERFGVAPAARHAQEFVSPPPISEGAGRHVLLDGSHTKSGAQSVLNAHETAHVPVAGTHKNGLHGVLCPLPSDDSRSSEHVAFAGKHRPLVSLQV